MWENTGTSLKRDFSFADFREAFAFITRVALLAEKMEHHPTIINSYNAVTLELTTHDAKDTITIKDRKLASAIDLLVL